MTFKLYLLCGTSYGVIITKGNDIFDLIDYYRKLGAKIIGYQKIGG